LQLLSSQTFYEKSLISGRRKNNSNKLFLPSKWLLRKMKMKMEMKVGVLHAKGNFLKVWSSKKKVCGKKVVVFSL
jgi:hypothetical protein